MKSTSRTWTATVLSLTLIAGCRFGHVFAQDSSGSPEDSKPTSKQSTQDGQLPPHALMRLGSLRYLPICEQTDRIEYSPEGRCVATVALPEAGGLLHGITIWDRPTGQDVTPAELREVDATGISWSPNGMQFATSHPPGCPVSGLNLWTIGEDKPLPFARKDVSYSFVTWAPKGGRIAAKTWDDDIVIFNLQGTEQHRFALSGKWQTLHGARLLDFSLDGSRLAVVSDPGVQVYDVENGKVVAEIRVDGDIVWAIRIFPDAQSIGVAVEKGVMVFKIGATSDVPARFGEYDTLDFAVSRNQRWLVTSGFFTQKQAGVWDLKSGARIHSFKDRTGGGVAIAPDDSELTLSTRRISFLKTETWEPVFVSHDSAVGLVSGVIRNNRIWTGGIGSTIREWDLSTGKFVRSLSRRNGESTAIADIDEQLLAVAGESEEIDIVNEATGQFTSTIPGHASGTVSLNYSKQQKRLISSGNGTLRGWSLESKTPVFETVVGGKFGLFDLVISPDGKLVVGSQYETGQSCMFRVSDGRPLWAKRSSVAFSRAAFIPDSSQVAIVVFERDQAANENIWSIRFHSSISGKEKTRLDFGFTHLGAFAIAPDGKSLAVVTDKSSTGSEIQIWSLNDRKRIASLRGGHFDRPRWLGFTTDGNRLISLSQDSLGFVWDVPGAITQYKSNQ